MDLERTLSVVPEEAPITQPLSVVTEDTSPMLPADVVETRSAKAAYGLKVDKEDLRQQIIQGKEKQIRDAQASQETYAQTIARNQAITDFARAKGTGLTTLDLDNLKNFINVPPANPSTVFEKNYSSQFISQLKDTPGFPGSWFDDAIKREPEEAKQSIDIANDYTIKVEYARTREENAQAKLENQSWPGYIADLAKSSIPIVGPLYIESKLRGLVEETGKFHGLLGSNLEEQAHDLLTRPIPQYVQLLDNIMDNLERDNPQLAVAFIKYVRGVSSQEKFIDNVFSAAGPTDLSIVGGAVRKLSTRSAEALAIRDLLKSTAKTATRTTKSPEVLAAEAAGDLETAARLNMSTRTAETIAGRSNPEKEALEALPTALEADERRIASDTAGRWSREILNRFVENAQTFRHNLIDAVGNIARVERIPAVLASKDVLETIKEDFKYTYHGIRNAILDVGVLDHNAITNTYTTEIKLGRHTGELFTDKEEAIGFARNNGIVVKGLITPAEAARQAELHTLISFATGEERKALEKEYGLIGPSKTGATMVPQGKGFYISVTKPLDETSSIVRDAIVTLKTNETPGGWFNAFAGWISTPNETLSLEQTRNRTVSAYAQSVLMKVAKAEAQHIKQIAKWTFPGTKRREMFQQWKQAVEHSKDVYDKDGLKGAFFDRPTDLDLFYRTTFGRGASEAEVNAYFSWVRLTEMDRTLRNLAVYRNMSRLGTEMHAITAGTLDGGKETSPFFHGVVRHEIPRSTSETVWVQESVGGVPKVGVYPEFGTKKWNELAVRVKKGELKVIELNAPEHYSLKGFGDVGDSRVRYVITPTSDSKPIEYQQIPRRGGGHFEYDYDHFIRQANVKIDKTSGYHWYNGDTTVMPIANRALGNDVVKILEDVRLKLKAKDVAGAKLAGAKLGMPWSQVHGWFTTGRLSTEDAFMVVPKGKAIIDLPGNTLREDHTITKVDRKTKLSTTKEMLKDGTKEGSLNKQWQVAFTGERDAEDVFTLIPGGTGTALFQHQPAQFIDPIASMTRAMTSIVKSNFMDDYKIFSMEHWLQENSRLFKTDVDWRTAPFYYFNKAKEFYASGVSAEEKSRAELSRFQIRQFTGIASDTQGLLDSLSQTIADSIYRRTGIVKVPAMLDIANLTKVPDFIHSVTFHAAIGLWSIPQLIVQSMTYSSIFGIAGAKMAGPGTFAAQLHFWSRLNSHPDILSHMDRLASSAGWKPGEFLEAQRELNKTGFGIVSTEHMIRDHVYGPKLIQKGVSQVLDSGLLFFNGAERNMRYGAWYTAFKEFRRDNPTGIITQGQRNAILARADLLSGNMTNASKSNLQRGPLAFTTQFLGYALRQAELVMGHRLTPIERTRLLVTNAAMYGIPVTAGAATLVPFNDWFRQKAVEHGYIAPGVIGGTLMNGVPALIGNLISGDYYNIGNRYGNAGLDALSSDRPFWQILTGASGTTFKNAFASLSPFYRAMLDHVTGSQEQYPITANDFVQPLTASSTVSSGKKLWMAWNTGSWFSRNETKLGEASPLNAIFRTTTGLSPQMEQDVHAFTKLIADREALIKDGQNAFSVVMRRGFRALQDNDPDTARQFFIQGRRILIQNGIPIEKYAETYSRAADDKHTLPSRLLWNIMYKDVSPNDIQTMRKARQDLIMLGKQ